MRCTLQFDVGYASFRTDLSFLRAAPFCVHHEKVGLHFVEGGEKVNHSSTLVDVGLLH